MGPEFSRGYKDSVSLQTYLPKLEPIGFVVSRQVSVPGYVHRGSQCCGSFISNQMATVEGETCLTTEILDNPTSENKYEGHTKEAILLKPCFLPFGCLSVVALFKFESLSDRLELGSPRGVVLVVFVFYWEQWNTIRTIRRDPMGMRNLPSSSLCSFSSL